MVLLTAESLKILPDLDYGNEHHDYDYELSNTSCSLSRLSMRSSMSNISTRSSVSELIPNHSNIKRENCCSRCFNRFVPQSMKQVVWSVGRNSLGSIFQSQLRTSLSSFIHSKTHLQVNIVPDTRHNVYSGATHLQELRDMLQRLLHFKNYSLQNILWKQISLESMFLEDIVCISEAEADDVLITTIAEFLEKVNQEDDRILAALESMKNKSLFSCFSKRDAEESINRSRRGTRRSLMRELNLRRHIDFILLSDKCLDILKKAALSSDTAVLRSIQLSWQIHYRRSSGHCKCSKDDSTFCKKCYNAALDFSGWVKNFMSLSADATVTDTLFTMLCSHKYSRDVDRNLIHSPTMWITITEVLNYMDPHVQRDVLTKLNWLLIERIENRQMVVVQKDWFRGILQCVPVEYGEDILHAEIYNLSFNILSQLYFHLLLTSKNFTHHMGATTMYLKSTNMGGETSKAFRTTVFSPEAQMHPAFFDEPDDDDDWGDGHSQEMLRVLLISLLTRVAKWKNPGNAPYNSFEWINIISLSAFVRWFAFDSLKWNEIKHIHSSRTRGSRMETCVVQQSERRKANGSKYNMRKSTMLRSRTDSDLDKIQKKGSTLEAVQRESDKFVASEFTRKKILYEDVGLHLDDDFNLLDHKMISKAIELKSKLLVSFNFELQPSLTLKEKQFLSQWKTYHQLFCDCEKIMAEITYRHQKKADLRMRGQLKTPHHGKLGDDCSRYFTLMRNASHGFSSEDINYIFYMITSVSSSHRTKLLARLFR